MKFQSLQAWLDWQATLHPRSIDLGLQRVQAVAQRLDLLRPASMVITVGGTNGKGSSVALLEAVFVRAARRVATYSSPHLHAYNERIRLDGQPARDDAIMRAFDAIETARGDVTLSYFEFGTLAALWLAREHVAEILILEVGLGGRLDAVNIIDADVALITSIGIDHTEWLGNDLDTIGREKAGVARAGQPFVVAQPDAPAGLLAAAEAAGARVIVAGQAYIVDVDEREWSWRWAHCGDSTGSAGMRVGDAAANALHWQRLPYPALPGFHQIQNAAGVLAALTSLPPKFVPNEAVFRAALTEVRLPGRFERIVRGNEIILDVAHNADGARVLATTLEAAPCAGRTVAVFGIMRDKDAAAMLAALAACVDVWYLVRPDVERALPVEVLVRDVLAVSATPESAINLAASVAAGVRAALEILAPADRLLVTGSFYTVAEARQLLL